MLTNKGIDLAPIIMEVVIWSDQYVREYNTNMNAYNNSENKTGMIDAVQAAYKEFVQETMA